MKTLRLNILVLLLLAVSFAFFAFREQPSLTESGATETLKSRGPEVIPAKLSLETKNSANQEASNVIEQKPIQNIKPEVGAQKTLETQAPSEEKSAKTSDRWSEKKMLEQLRDYYSRESTFLHHKLKLNNEQIAAVRKATASQTQLFLKAPSKNGNAVEKSRQIRDASEDNFELQKALGKDNYNVLNDFRAAEAARFFSSTPKLPKTRMPNSTKR